MASLRIAEVAARTGIPATTLRYYEQIGLLATRRDANGYRSYGERDLDRLAFVTRARRLDLGLDQLRELVEAWDTDDCAAVRHSMAEAIAVRLAETRTRIADLTALAAQLEAAGRRLTGSPAAGPCGPDCPCADDRGGVGAGEPLGCALDAEDLSVRLADWRGVLATAARTEPIPGGVRLVFGRDADAGALARLAAAENACCPVFRFGLGVDAAGVTLDVTAPGEAADAVTALFGGGPTLPAQHLTRHNVHYRRLAGIAECCRDRPVPADGRTAGPAGG